MRGRRLLEPGLLMMSLVACANSGSQPVAAGGPAPAASAPAPAGTGAFRYDATTGRCQDASGKAGHNPPDPAKLFPAPEEGSLVYRDIDAECVDFSGFDFGPHIGLVNAMLQRWNFRGARFDGAKFVFANIDGADFAGADLTGLSFGYATIGGKGDAFTKGDTCAPGEGYVVFCMK